MEETCPQCSERDASVDRQANSIGIGGGVVRNWEGGIMASFCIPEAPARDPEVAEAMALRKTMQLCAYLGFHQVEFDGDCHSIVRASKSAEEINSEMGPIIQDVRFLLQRSEGWEVRFDYR